MGIGGRGGKLVKIVLMIGLLLWVIGGYFLRDGVERILELRY